MNRLPLHHILCPIDLSPLSMNSLEWANAVARARNAQLSAFQVVVAGGLVPPEDPDSLERGDMVRKLREALITIDSENSHTGAAVRQGDPGTEILQFARTAPADLIVMGAAGAERPTRPIGSVTATVVARSDCPGTDRAQCTTNRSVTSRRVQTHFVCGRSGAIFYERHQASALARMGDTWTRYMRLRYDRTRSVFIGDSESVIGGDPS